MNPTVKHAALSIIVGVIQHVDEVNRDVTVLANGQRQVVDVPHECAIRLNGEFVRLRLLQPGDRVRLGYVCRNDVRAAEWIEAGIRRVK